MKKINDSTWQYKGCYVSKDSCGNYVAKVLVNGLKLPMTICGRTQKSFKNSFNRLVKENGGLAK